MCVNNRNVIFAKKFVHKTDDLYGRISKFLIQIART